MPLKGKQNSIQCLSSKILLVCTHHLSWQANFMLQFSGHQLCCLLSVNFSVSSLRSQENNKRQRDAAVVWEVYVIWAINSYPCFFSDPSAFHSASLTPLPKGFPSTPTPRSINANELCISEVTSYQLINFMLQLFFSSLDWKPLNQGLCCLALLIQHHINHQQIKYHKNTAN